MAFCGRPVHQKHYGRKFIVRILALATICGSLVRPGAAQAGQLGLASWHDPSGGSCRTASEHCWLDSEMVAAHRTLPMGTKVRVVNLSNGHEAVVRITDRGPYGRRRIIDVSRCAARQLGLLRSGTARVRLEPLPPDGA